MKQARIRKLEQFIGMAPKSGPRVLVADIETFPILAYVWGLFKQNVSLDQIKEDWSVMSFAAKWLLIPGTYYVDNRNRENPKDDSITMHQLIRILEHTDMVIAHNGQRFDVPKIRARAALLGHPPMAPVKVVDTLLLNRKSFAFTSQKLAYVSDKFSISPKTEHAKFPGWKLWLGCMEHNRAAWRECEDYNVTDVTSLEESYLALRGWYEGGPNMAIYIEGLDKGEHSCPNCGSHHVVKKGSRRTQVGIYQRYNCVDCGGWSRGRCLIAGRDERAHVLMN